HGALAELVGVEVDEEAGRRASDLPVADPDVEDGGGLAPYVLPDARRRQDMLGTAGDGRGPAVKGFVDDGRGVQPVDDRDLQAGIRQGNCQAEADQASAREDDVVAPALGACIAGSDHGRQHRLEQAACPAAPTPASAAHSAGREGWLLKLWAGASGYPFPLAPAAAARPLARNLNLLMRRPVEELRAGGGRGAPAIGKRETADEVDHGDHQALQAGGGAGGTRRQRDR